MSKHLDKEDCIDFIKKDFWRVHGKYGISQKDYDEWCNEFYPKLMKLDWTFEEFRDAIRARDEEFKDRTLDYQI